MMDEAAVTPTAKSASYPLSVIAFDLDLSEPGHIGVCGAGHAGKYQAGNTLSVSQPASDMATTSLWQTQIFYP
jgi:curli biogenesis system outer membrane secretion channel CsgG